MANQEQVDRLMNDVGQWNIWRAMNPHARVDLSGYAFERISLHHADLSQANLSEATFDRCDLGEVDFSHADLSKVHIDESHVREASFYSSNLSNADIQKSDLSKSFLRESNLFRVRFLDVNLSAACFTGAMIREWYINDATQLDGVEAEFVYADIIGADFQKRRPRSGNFKLGEFVALLQQALDTIDLAFIDGINWQVFFASFQELRQQYSDAELNIQAIEKKNGDAFIVRLEVSGEADKAAIEKSAREGYEQQLQLIEARYQAQLQAKDTEIESHKRESANMLEITKLLASKPITVEAKAVAENKPVNQTNYGGTNFQNDISGGEVNQAETMNINRSSFTNNMQGATVGNFANQLSGNAQQIYNAAPDKSLAEAAQEIQALLDQLSETYPTDNVMQRAELATIAAQQAKANLTLWQRIVSAIDAGTIGAVGEMLSHPVATFFIDAAQDLAETKPQA